VPPGHLPKPILELPTGRESSARNVKVDPPDTSKQSNQGMSSFKVGDLRRMDEAIKEEKKKSWLIPASIALVVISVILSILLVAFHMHPTAHP
jgi:hypothetical protein